MGVPNTINRPLPVDESLRLEAASQVRHEYVAGELFAMAGASRRHTRIAMNIATACFAVTRQRRDCETFVADGLLQAADDVFYYPDVMVACGPATATDRVVRDPSVLVEVTPPRTAAIDHREKLATYRRIASLRTYLIVEQSRRHVERHWRNEGGEWRSETPVGDGRVPVPALDIELTLQEIYDGAELPAVGDAEAGDSV
jgi:Uma2 family endonuclease